MVSKSKLFVARRLEPLMLKAELSASPVPVTRVYVNVFPASGSVVLNAPTIAFAPEFSAIDLGERSRSIGVSLTLVTAIVNTFSTNSPP